MPDIIIKDEQGNDVVYSNVNTVRFRDNNNGIASYRYNSGEVTPTDYDYTVIFAENDGTVIKTYYVDAGDSVVAPTPATIEGWTFNCWRYNGDLTNVDQNIIALPYYTKTGVPLTSDYIRFCNCVGSISIYFYFDAAGTILIDWGDGQTNTLRRTSVGISSTNHNYDSQYLYTYFDITVSAYTEGVIWRFHVNNGNYCPISPNNGIICMQIHSGVTQIYNNLLRECYEVKLVSIPDGVQTISANAFEKSALNTLSLPSSVTRLENYVCTDSSIKYFVADGLTYIGQRAFAGSEITEFIAGSGLSCIYSDAFNGCYKLNKLSLYATDIIGETTYNSQFRNCYALNEVYMPYLTKIPSYMFNSCSNLNFIELNNAITSIGDYAFTSTKLQIDEIPATVTNIGMYAFSSIRCKTPPFVSGINVYPITPPTASANIFGSNVTTYRPIHVPADSLNAYKTATSWSSYANYMIGDL